MKEFEVLLKTVADGLEAMADGIHVIAKKVVAIAETQAQEKPSKIKKATRTRKAKPVSKKVTKKSKIKGTRPLPATEKVLKVIKKSKAGVDNVTIAKKTGLDRKQVANALSQLKKTGKVKSVKKGVHAVA
jgi:predicted Rossmann fold nucleotide-binding protein DprA/Smf involved in DNA uptake